MKKVNRALANKYRRGNTCIVQNIFSVQQWGKNADMSKAASSSVAEK